MTWRFFTRDIQIAACIRYYIPRLHLYTLQEPLFYSLQRIVMGHDSNILHFAAELLMRVNAGSEHLRSGSRCGLAHLLLHLTRRYIVLESSILIGV